MVPLFLVELIQKHTNIGRFRPKPPQKYPPREIFFIDRSTGLFGQETDLELSTIGHSPIGQIQKCWQQTDPYLGSPSDSEGFWALEINNYVSGFVFLVKYWVPDIRNPHTSSVLGRHHSDFSFIEGTKQ